MSNVHETDRNSIGDTAVQADPSTLTLQYGDWKVPVAQLGAASLAYLLQNGFSQSMSDAAAMTKEQKSVKTGTKVANPDKPGEEIDETRPMTDAEVSAEAKRLRDERFARIVAGTVGFRVGGGPRGSQIDTIMRQVATERLRAALGKKKLSLPTGKDKSGNVKTLTVGGKAYTRDELIAAHLAKNEAEIRVIAQARIDENAEATGEVEDLIG